MAPKIKKKHSGLDLLRLALGEALPDKARKGALMPKHLAVMAGVNYETVRQLLNGARDFSSDTPLNRLMAENLSVTTGVHPDFRTSTERFIVDIWGEKYTGETYRAWLKDDPLSETMRARITMHQRWIKHKSSGINLPQGGMTLSPLMEQLTAQSENLLRSILKAAKVKGTQFESMAFRLLKGALVGVAKDLGVLTEVSTDESLQDFQLQMQGGYWTSMGALMANLKVVSWDASAPAFTFIPGPGDETSSGAILKREIEKAGLDSLLADIRPFVRRMNKISPANAPRIVISKEEAGRLPKPKGRPIPPGIIAKENALVAQESIKR